jgi:hypothetical protein
MLKIDEYTDPHHNATVPHTLVLAPGLVIDKSYVGYWFFGRPSAYQLWDDLQGLFRRIKQDFDPTLASASPPGVGASQRGRRALDHPDEAGGVGLGRLVRPRASPALRMQRSARPTRCP